MEIRLPVKLEKMFQEAIEVFDSYNDPDDAQNLRQTCQSFLQGLTGKVRDALETNYYLALAMYGMVKFADEKNCLSGLCEGELPSWDDIQIKKPAVCFVTEMRNCDDDLAKQAVVVAFLLGRADKVVKADGSCFERSDITKDKEESATAVDEFMEEGEEHDEYA
ncbi:MAG: hypothetical protein NT116_04755, partial [Candidatus Parcubacteria bacterium]|nr:hypothetical protein [Candidatus Parcubacteria bacterium]